MSGRWEAECRRTPITFGVDCSRIFHISRSFLLLLRTQNSTIRVVISSLKKREGLNVKMSLGMRRVSSRQRLNSFGDYAGGDLGAVSGQQLSLDDSDYMTCYESLSRVSSLEDMGMSSVLNRKRIRIRKDVVVVVDVGLVDVVVDDVKFHILSFLDVKDGRALSLTNSKWHRMIQDADFQWKQWCHQQWPSLNTTTQFVDSSSSSNKRINYSSLLTMASNDFPSKIHPSHFINNSTGTGTGTGTTTKPPLFQCLDEQLNIVQFTGLVGTGDRCIRSNHPLPQPQKTDKQLQKKQRFLPFNVKNILRKKLSKRHPQNNKPKPFVCPFQQNDGTIDLTPRRLTYFEIYILPNKPNQQSLSTTQSTPSSSNRFNNTSPTTTSFSMTPPQQQVTDCVAIGLSSEQFATHSRMPGWDTHSYGYHGDDGGIFHASGDMLKHFGPAFGKGDTIGCGVDYSNNSIFFTLNGEFLGYAWTGLKHLPQKLYPTIGVDTNYPIQCNFYSNFKFDLGRFLKTKANQSTK